MAEVVNEIPADAIPVNGDGVTQPPQTTVSFRPVRFTATSLWESPCFWIVIGSALTLLAIHAMRKKGF